jgi:MYXO-CTERM domain-containing protein
MNCRFASPLALVLALAVPSVALADVPSPDGGGTGGSSSATPDPSCNLATQARGGTTCAECTNSGGDTNCQGQLGADYSYVCKQSATVEIWCNGPSRDSTVDPSGCAVGTAPASSGAALAALAALAVLARRRRTRA